MEVAAKAGLTVYIYIYIYIFIYIYIIIISRYHQTQMA